MTAMRIVVIGAGGQARDTAWLLRELGPGFEHVGFVVTDASRLTARDSPVLGEYAWLEQNRTAFDGFALGIGTPAARLRVGADLRARFPEKAWPALVHPRVEIDRASLRLGEGTMIGAGVVGSVHIVLEDFALVNLGVTLGHEAHLGRGVVVNHNASIAGGVVLEAGVLVGSSAAVLQYLRVGDGATVGAGAVVTRSIEPRTTVVGVPARELRRR
jgi:sugar O-acyltransferase (sialic acid O-acetyltransferase NeuD family)